MSSRWDSKVCAAPRTAIKYMNSNNLRDAKAGRETVGMSKDLDRHGPRGVRGPATRGERWRSNLLDGD